VRALTEKDIRRSFVNCPRSEAATMTVPRNLWRDDRPLGLALRATETAGSARTAVMCLLCRSTGSGGDVALFTARRAGEAGRNGNTVGQYICADLRCSQRIRTDIPPWLRDRDPDEVVPSLAGELLDRVETFARHVVCGR